jgi:surface protein
MAEMFSGAAKFNKPVGSWETGMVTNMKGMFSDAELCKFTYTSAPIDRSIRGG